MIKKLQELMAQGLANEEIIKALTTDGHAVEDISKALAEQGVSEEDMQKALTILEDLAKSDDEGDDLDALIKALEVEEANLQKSDDNDADDQGGDDAEGGEEDDDLEKSLGSGSLELEELIKASEMYAEMTDEVRKSHGDIMTRMNALDRMVLAQSNLLIKSATTLAEMAKSIQAMAGAPAAGARGVLGFGDEKKDEIVKSRSDIQSALFKACHEGRVDNQFLSVFAVRGADALPANVKKEIGL
jgi:hypothetical protein